MSKCKKCGYMNEGDYKFFVCSKCGYVNEGKIDTIKVNSVKQLLKKMGEKQWIKTQRGHQTLIR